MTGSRNLLFRCMQRQRRGVLTALMRECTAIRICSYLKMAKIKLIKLDKPKWVLKVLGGKLLMLSMSIILMTGRIQIQA